MRVNTAFLFTASFCYYVASALRIDPSELRYLSVASPETSQLQNFQNSNNDILKDGDMFEKRADVQPSGEAPLDIRINDFFEHLKGFTIMGMFRFAPFAAESPRLDRELTELVRHVKTLPVPDPILLNRVHFAQIVFQDMKYASEIYKTLPQFLDINESILRNLIQLYVTLFNYRDLDGSPNPSMHEYGTWMRSLSIATEKWAQEFGVANESPIALRLLFDRQLSRVRGELEVLKSAMTDEA
ncbi:hypothetical protein OY671_005416 [Metschnikowia pulcherrima]|nr:hypothetical protein OY671_005416 [Metschnikowia pulcherrima]